MMIKPQEPPERIFGWLESQLSIARFYGGLKYQGHQYHIAIDEDRQPLVRADVLQRENREKADRLKVASRQERIAAEQAQGDFL